MSPHRRNGSITPEEKIKKRRDYFREYRIKNADRIRTLTQAASRRHYLRNKERMATKYCEIRNTKEYKDLKNRQRRQYMEKWKEAIYKQLGDRCSSCKYSDRRALQIDHINSDGYLENKKRNATHYKKVAESIRRGENRYQILCANCNWIKRYDKNEFAYQNSAVIIDYPERKQPKEATLFSLQDISTKLV